MIYPHGEPGAVEFLYLEQEHEGSNRENHTGKDAEHQSDRKNTLYEAKRASPKRVGDRSCDSDNG